MSRKKSRRNKIDRPVKQPDSVATFWRKKLPLILIGLAGLVAYANSFQGAFVFDDMKAIRDNQSIRQLSSLGQVLFPDKTLVAKGVTVEGRPLLNLSFALNYAVGGLEVWGYHAVNLLLHVLAGMTLYGIVRRTILRVDSSERLGSGSAQWLSLVVALLWVVHPLQTESVTYIVQRAESLVGLLYLLTLYCFIRGLDESRWWRAGSVFVCALGMTAKEIMVTAPLVILLYDWVFVARSMRQALRERWGFYLALFSTWAVLAALLLGTGGSNLDILRLMFSPASERGAMTQIVGGTTWWNYALTQFGTLMLYLRLCIWPEPLILDYGIETASGFWEIVPPALMVLILFAATVVGVWRKHWAGYAGAWFFLILAPTTSVVPTNQTVAEHRMYLPLAAVLVLLVVGGYVGWCRLQRRLARGGESSEMASWLVPGFMLLLILQALILQTLARNRDYHSQRNILRDTILKKPANPRAQFNYGLGFLQNGDVDEALPYFQKAVVLKPDFVDARNNLGKALLEKGQVDEAITHLQKVVAINPHHSDAHHNLGLAFLQKGRLEQAIFHSQNALKLKPDYIEAHINLGKALGQAGRLDEAAIHYEAAIRINPKETRALNNLAWILATSPDITQRNGARSLDLALLAKQYSAGKHADVLQTLAAAYAECGRFADAMETAERALVVATEENKNVLVDAIRNELKLYQEGKPFRDIQTVAPSSSTSR